MAQPLRAAPISVPTDASIAERSGSGFAEHLDSDAVAGLARHHRSARRTYVAAGSLAGPMPPKVPRRPGARPLAMVVHTRSSNERGAFGAQQPVGRRWLLSAALQRKAAGAMLAIAIARPARTCGYGARIT
ncbi:hypothetical protein [Xanthomonas campestris]|uniref:hypothetical protein n=1 Tax=Xanthomonas campestris TaxID=339 RepID=UPI0015F27175|nr:hypothetical protein [Xanthomonas campestris]MEA9843100.1 hypothetical protein [Xanthomonas campestris pv. raphani]